MGLVLESSGRTSPSKGRKEKMRAGTEAVKQIVYYSLGCKLTTENAQGKTKQSKKP